jgi:hypothetical protein
MQNITHVHTPNDSTDRTCKPQLQAKQSPRFQTGGTQFTMASMEAREKLALINENLAEVLNPELIESVLAEGRNLRVYWGSFHDILL